MMWIIGLVVILILLVLCWLIFSPFEMMIDTRVPQVYVKWVSIGKGRIVYEQEKWLLKTRALFFSKDWELEKLFFGERKKKIIKKNRPKKKVKKWMSVKKIIRVIKTFRISKWQVAIDTGDDSINARLYGLNFYPSVQQHLFINFFDENYLFVVVRTAPWKIIRAWLK